MKSAEWDRIYSATTQQSLQEEIARVAHENARMRALSADLRDMLSGEHKARVQAERHAADAIAQKSDANERAIKAEARAATAERLAAIEAAAAAAALERAERAEPRVATLEAELAAMREARDLAHYQRKALHQLFGTAPPTPPEAAIPAACASSAGARPRLASDAFADADLLSCALRQEASATL